MMLAGQSSSRTRGLSSRARKIQTTWPHWIRAPRYCQTVGGDSLRLLEQKLPER